MASTSVRGRRPHRLKTAGLVTCLIILLVTAVGFTISAVQIQSAIAGYVGGNGIWSRAQLTAVSYLDAYAAHGRPEDLRLARQWLDIPLGDMDARLAMEERPLNYEAARQGMLRGDNHPDDLAGMIRLFRYFADLGVFHKAVEAWRDTDPYLLELNRIAQSLAGMWASSSPDTDQIRTVQARLDEVNQELQVYARRFRVDMGEAARWTTTALSVVSAVLLILLALVAWRLGARLAQIQQRSEQKFRSIFEQSAVGILQIDSRGIVIDANQAACQILDTPDDRLLHTPFMERIHPEDLPMDAGPHRALLRGRMDSYTLEQRLQKGSGEHLWARLTVSMVNRRAGEATYFVVMLEDISESRRLASELSYQATHDALTGLFNRREFEHRLAKTLGRARAERSEHALCFLDLDQFKVVNDTSGHAAGDQLLRDVARLAESRLREGDILARLGGDEFGLILQNCPLETAAGVTEKLRQALTSIAFTWEGETHSVGASIGVVPISAGAPDVVELLRSVDIACYMAKEGGRNRVYVSSSDDRQLHLQRGEMAWINRIQAALNENRFYLDAQRILPAADNRQGLRYEVLIRLTNEQGETVSPAAFLPAAERFGVVHKIDRWVISEVIGQLARARQHLDALDACHINLSGRTLDHPDLADFILDELNAHNVPGSKLCFEITETAAVHNLLDVRAFMTRLQQLGCTFALDDFGTGLSSFGYLRQLPVDCLKIDGSFVRNITRDRNDLAMVRAIHDIGRTLDKLTVAECVEGAAAAELLREVGVDYLQGFGLHHPCRFRELLYSGSRPNPDGEPSMSEQVR
ncbi:EAL domain-containing protein [Marinobacter halodurans]|uniref:EAL domain-containing protein n=1 Tax=Marinobacter halodurans TaxID=2528979 RepID=A0ABY1ZNP8_9GAMM|nr:EAL domain-containing protein [Marinobacter halodurans]TBW55171.1 EAL domain-containing protein [Marinobacter halodurans]